MFNKELFLKKIQKIKVKPRWVFIIRFLWLLIGSLISTLIVIFVLSLIIFMLFYGENNLISYQELLSFKMIFNVFPWAIIGLLIVFLIIFELFIKKLLPLYKMPVLITVILITILLGLSSFFVNQNSKFKSMCQCRQNKFKLIEWIMLRNQSKYNKIVKTGIVNKIYTDKVEIKIGEDVLMVDKKIFCGYCLSGLKENDNIIISGNWISGEFVPFRIKKDMNCQECSMENEIKSQGSCNNM